MFFIEKTIIVFDQVLAKQGACLGEAQILACISDFARKKSYISAHSSKKSQAAYKALGCVHAREITPWIADEEPFDVQLEYVL